MKEVILMTDYIYYIYHYGYAVLFGVAFLFMVCKFIFACVDFGRTAKDAFKLSEEEFAKKYNG